MPDGGVAMEGCTQVVGTFVVRASSVTDCRSDNTKIQNEPPGQVCNTNFDATLAISSTSGAAANITGTLNAHFQQAVVGYDCGFGN